MGLPIRAGIPRASASMVARQACVTAKNGALVRRGVELDTDLVGAPLPTGTAVSVEDEATSSRGVPRLRISDPSSGWVSKKVVTLAAPPARPDDRPSAASMRRELGLPPMPSNHPCPLQRLAPRACVATLALG